MIFNDFGTRTCTCTCTCAWIAHMHMHMHTEPLRVRASETQSLNSVQFLSKLISKSTQIIQKSNLIGLQHLQKHK